MKKIVKKELSVENYKGHVIRRIEDEFGYEHVFVDMDSNTFEDAPLHKKVNEWDYASVADAKRVINGKKPKYIPMDLIECIGKEKYYNRFKQ